MRFDRFITLGIVKPARWVSGLSAGAQPAGRERRLPILMYHSVSEDREEGVAPYFRTATAPRRFAEQMRALRLAGWRAVSLREGLADLAMESTARPSEKLVVLTFDDGFGDFITEAMPVLRKLDFRATMFLTTAYVSAGPARLSFCGRDCLTWPEVKGLDSEGIEFGSHTQNHPRLIDLTWAEIESEVAVSKAEIERQTGRPVENFAYPYAFPQSRADFRARLREVLLQEGYQACVTTRIGCAAADDDPYDLPRLPVNGADDLALFGAKLEGAYDWVAIPQRAGKALARFRSPGLRAAC